MKNIFDFVQSAYHLRSNSRLERHTVKSERYKTEIISHLRLKMWNLLPKEYKDIGSLSAVKRKKFKLGNRWMSVMKNMYRTSGIYLNVHLSSHSYVCRRVHKNMSSQEFGSGWMSIERKSIWKVRVINKCHV